MEVVVPAGYKILGGGARVDWNGAGNLLTASYPETETKWVATSRDHSVRSGASIEAWVIAIHDPHGEWTVAQASRTSDLSAHPTARASLPPGFLITGGGARVRGSETGAGNLLTASYPVDLMTWEASSKDHIVNSPATVTSYVIGIRPVACTLQARPQIFSNRVDEAAHPQAAVHVPDDFILTGGGARVQWRGTGSLLTASHPSSPQAWSAAAKDHAVRAPASLTVYSIGWPRQP